MKCVEVVYGFDQVQKHAYIVVEDDFTEDDIRSELKVQCDWDRSYIRMKVLPEPGKCKILIYGSKEIYDNSSFEGRAEADFIAYKDEYDLYNVVKDRIRLYTYISNPHMSLEMRINGMERFLWKKELNNG